MLKGDDIKAANVAYNSWLCTTVVFFVYFLNLDMVLVCDRQAQTRIGII